MDIDTAKSNRQKIDTLAHTPSPADLERLRLARCVEQRLDRRRVAAVDVVGALARAAFAAAGKAVALLQG